MNVYLAIDLGAGSGRVMAVVDEADSLSLEEIHRFQSPAVTTEAGLVWDMDLIRTELTLGLRRAATAFGSAIQSIGVDSWGVDYGWLDAEGQLIQAPFSYRDPRHEGIMDQLCERWGRDWIFEHTGIQFMPINSLYQWASDLRHQPEIVARAHCFLMIADLVNHWLTGQWICERSNASTTQLYDPRQRTWSQALTERLGLPSTVLPPLCDPGTLLGPLGKARMDETGLPPVPVVAVGSHDTASAVAGVPAMESPFAYLSCGTWALLGTERPVPEINQQVLAHNFTNETGVEGTFRLLKNITGLWVIQECRRHWQEAEGKPLSYEAMTRLTSDAPSGTAFIDPDDAVFSARGDHPQAIQTFCRDTGQSVPQTQGEILRVALESLALKVAATLDQLESLLPQPVKTLHVIGGGSQDRLLLQWIANATQRSVIAGPIEATSFGNALVQMIATGATDSLASARRRLRESVDLESFTPTASWAEFRQRFRSLLAK